MNNFDDKRWEKERSDYKFYRKNKTIYIEVYGSSFSKPISRTKKSVVWMFLSKVYGSSCPYTPYTKISLISQYFKYTLITIRNLV